tara:strand:+ start:293 stop:625 length:333 start_codon:yes stop_codon:yes gene_type:complete
MGDIVWWGMVILSIEVLLLMYICSGILRKHVHFVATRTINMFNMDIVEQGEIPPTYDTTITIPNYQESEENTMDLTPPPTYDTTIPLPNYQESEENMVEIPPPPYNIVVV